jgi:hypothetical protein
MNSADYHVQDMEPSLIATIGSSRVARDPMHCQSNFHGIRTVGERFRYRNSAASPLTRLAIPENGKA